MEPPPPSLVARFGTFEFRLDTGELLKRGIRLKVQDQPLRVLSLLIQNPGALVTRDQLRRALWPEDTFVDFENGLNACVGKLRQALGDSAENPRFVETVPRRGYRFVAMVTGLDSNHESVLEAPPTGAGAPPQQEAKKPGAQTVRPRTMVAIAGAGVVVALCLTALGMLRKPAAITPRTTARITWDGATVNPAISPDGRLLAYATKSGDGKSHIWVRQMAGGEPVQVTRGADNEAAPNFSPDGTQIVFSSEFDGGGIYTVSALGGNEPRLLVKGYGNPKYSPDGKDVLFFASVPDSPGILSEAYIVSVRGGTPRRLCPNWVATYGIWAPDGKAVLFFAARKKTPDSRKWMLASVAGGEPAEFQIPGGGASCPSAWKRLSDGRQWIVFDWANGDSTHLFRAEVVNGRLAGSPEQLTSGVGVSYLSDFSTDGKLVFTSGVAEGHIWIVQADTDRAQTHTAPEQMTHTDGMLNESPSLSRDGRWLAYAATNPSSADSSTRLRNLVTGAERQLAQSRVVGAVTSISPDGSQVAYTRDVVNENGLLARSEALLVPAAGGVPTLLCQNCEPRGFASGGSLLLTQQGWREGKLARAVAVSIPGGKAEDFLKDANHYLFHPFFSWDDRWVSFKMTQDSPGDRQPKLMIAPVHNGKVGDQREWISVTDGMHTDDKPQFSPDGNTLYFYSERDGHLCIWAQRLDRMTKRPSGAPFVVQHFHNARWDIPFNRYHEELCVARDKFVTNFQELRTDIWMMTLN